MYNRVFDLMSYFLIYLEEVNLYFVTMDPLTN